MTVETLYLRDDVREALGERATFDEIFGLEGRTYRESHDESRRTAAITLGNRRYFLKRHGGIGWREILKNLLNLKRPVLSARNEKWGIERLQQLGVPTMTIAAYGWRGRNPAAVESFILTDALPATESLEDFAPRVFHGRLDARTTRLKRALIDHVAGTARTLHRHGIVHQDLYICHFLLDLGGGDAALDDSDVRAYVIDLHRAQRAGGVFGRSVIKDLAALHFSTLDLELTRRDRLRFLVRYHDAPLRRVLREHGALWARVDRRARRLRRRLGPAGG